MGRVIFRAEALTSLTSPDQLDRLMEVTRPRAWIALVALGLLLALVAFWGFFGTIAIRVEGQGVLFRPGSMKLKAPRQAKVTAVTARIGDKVQKDQVILELESSGDAKNIKIVSPFPARVLDVVNFGHFVEKGDEVAAIEPLDSPLHAMIYVPLADGYKVYPGNASDPNVALLPASVNEHEFGYLQGWVRSAARFPSTIHSMEEVLGNAPLAGSLVSEGPRLEIVVDLLPDAQTPSGYHWSSSHGPNLELYSGTPCRAFIIVERKTPIALVFPALDKSAGR
jgi:hypothetical protein